MQTRPVIGILTNVKYADYLGTDHIYVNDEYVLSIDKVHGIPILIPPVMSYDVLDYYIKICDGFLLSGGGDINPIYTNQEPSPYLGTINNQLDNFQIILTKKILRSRKPILGICRGIQILNAALGGTTLQDLKEWNTPTILHMQCSERYQGIHKVHFEKGSTLYKLFGEASFVNSYHHQAVDKPGTGVSITGRSSDQIIEAIELKNYTFCVGVQWHPEMMFTHSDEMKELFEAFIQAAIPFARAKK